MVPVALIAERDASLRALMSRALREAGFEVRSHANGQQLKADLGATTADCSLLVLQMELVAQCLG
jgi:DNA-binding response OmpR family regulator